MKKKRWWMVRNLSRAEKRASGSFADIRRRNLRKR